MRGRRDELSEAYCEFTAAALEELFEIDPDNLEQGYDQLQKHANDFDTTPIWEFKRLHRSTKGSTIKNSNFSEEVSAHNVVIQKLTQPSDKFPGKSLNNDEDLLMVLDVLKLISCPERQNIYRYLKELIAQPSGIGAAYKELTNLRAVGDKIATFIIRDIGILNRGLISFCCGKFGQHFRLFEIA